MKAHIVVEGPSDAAILRRLLPSEVSDAVSVHVVGERNSPASVARTLLVSQRKPVALVVDADSNNPSVVQDRQQLLEELLRDAAGGVPTLVAQFVPEIEAIFFDAEGLLERLLGKPVSEEFIALAGNGPKAALTHLFQQNGAPGYQLDGLLKRLRKDDIESLRATSPLNDLISFLAAAVDRVQKAGA